MIFTERGGRTYTRKPIRMDDRISVALQLLHTSPKVVPQRIRLDADDRDILEGGDKVPMTENERRAQDVLTREDVVRRILVASGMIASFLSLLLIVNP